jgi:hypothetical protein
MGKHKKNRKWRILQNQKHPANSSKKQSATGNLQNTIEKEEIPVKKTYDIPYEIIRRSLIDERGYIIENPNASLIIAWLEASGQINPETPSPDLPKKLDIPPEDETILKAT